MKYEKAKAEVVLFDNSDVITGSNCKNGTNLNNCEHGNTNGNSESKESYPQ